MHFSIPFFCFCVLFFYLFPFHKINAAIRGCEHIEYFTSGTKVCGINNQNFITTFNDRYKIIHPCCSKSARGTCQSCCAIIIEYEVQTCSAWQKAISGEDYGICECEKECLDLPQNPKYYDDPLNKTEQADSARIHLPVVLAWSDIRGWTNPERKEEAQRTPVPDYNPGPKSYRVEIIYEEYPDTKDANLHIDKNKNPQGIETLPNGQKIFYKIITKSGREGFNSRDDGGACFFQTNANYRWRVLPCCDAAGTQCKNYRDNEGWWEFSTSPAPELLGVATNDTNSGFAENIEQDPDWNGPGAITGVDFCNATLYWCKAKLAEPGSNNYHRFNKKYNANYNVNYAFDYQMRVKSSENASFVNLVEKILTGASSAFRTATSYLGIGKFLKDYANSAATSDCSKWMNEPLKISTESEDESAGESYHYLQRDIYGKPAKPESLSFAPYSDGIANNPNFKPFFDASKNTSRDRSLFTGDWEGKLKYSWQIKTCFNTSPGQEDNDFPYCNANVEKDYGQKWQLVGLPMSSTTIGKPLLTSPENNDGWVKEDHLVGTNGTLNWKTPCGANSFLYDIKNENGKSIFDGDPVCGTDYSKDAGRRFDKPQIIVNITDKEPEQGQNPGAVQLKIDSKYTWRVKSCWPSIPVGEIKNICSSEWSDSWSFRTTGRPPKINDSDAVRMAAPTATLSWEGVSGAQSYRLKITGDGAPTEEILVDTDQFSFKYPGPQKNYSWRVKTCADAGGIICGSWQAGKSFNSEDFAKPTNLSPAGEISQLPLKLTWNGAAPYYLVTAKVSDGENNSSCDSDWFNREYNKKIVSSSEMAIRAAEKKASQYCGGNYEFTVHPCFDSNCISMSLNDKKAEQKFSIAPKDVNSGFMVCGQASNDTKTPYNEKEPCEIKHLVLTTKIIVDFVIFKLAFLLLPVMLMITGAMFYLSHDKANLIPTLKDGWKKIGIGYGILFFAWIIVSILMVIVGYGELWNQIL